MKIGCIIPAFNESSRIANVLKPAIDFNLFTKLIVVDDGSEDDTTAAAKRFPGVEVITLARHAGKSTAVAHALPRLLSFVDTVCLLDADLDGLTVADIENLIAPVRDGQARVSISSRKSYRVFRLDFDVLSGERVVPIGLLLGCELASRPSMGMEVAINEALITLRYSIAVVAWPGVSNPCKETKRGFRAGLREDFQMVRQVHSMGVGTLIRQRWKLGKQLV